MRASDWGPPRVVKNGWLGSKEVARAYQCFFLLALALGLGIVMSTESGTGLLPTGLVCLSVAYLYSGGSLTLFLTWVLVKG